MQKRSQDEGQSTERERQLSAREQAMSTRESRIDSRERASGDHERVLAEREDLVGHREEALREHAEGPSAESDREWLLGQMREANEQLLLATLRADELAEKARAGEQVKDEFLAMLGHELRNPLAPIMTAIDLMEMRDASVFPRERALIKRQVAHMVRLVDDLLDISRITGGKIELQCEPVELASEIARAVEMASPLLETKRHQLIVRVPDDGLVVQVDPARFVQVVTNLITNAAKYTPAGGQIVVSGTREGANVVLRVHDNGIGISAELLPRVFELFTQERQAPDRPQGGLGLGLAIVKTLVALHAGTVRASSEGLGKGSEFVVELPAYVATTSPRVAVSAAPAPATAALKILIVDDNEDTADLMGGALSERGHDVRVAHDAPSALAAVDDFAPDVAILDIGLPGMDGYELATHLRERRGDAIRLVAISGYGRPDDRERSLRAGFAKHLVKPVTLTDLQNSLR